LTAAAVTLLTSVAMLGISPAPASAAGPGYQEAHYYNTSGVNIGSATVNPKTTDHYDIAVADKVTDGLRACLYIQVDDEDGYRELRYCDDNGTSAAQHYQIYYDWVGCFLLVGRGYMPCQG
jgi:hypothetical protein